MLSFEGRNPAVAVNNNNKLQELEKMCLSCTHTPHTSLESEVDSANSSGRRHRDTPRIIEPPGVHFGLLEQQ